MASRIWLTRSVRGRSGEMPMEFLTFVQNFLGEQSFSRPRASVVRCWRCALPSLACRCLVPAVGRRCFLFSWRMIIGSLLVFLCSRTVLLGDEWLGARQCFWTMDELGSLSALLRWNGQGFFCWRGPYIYRICLFIRWFRYSIPVSHLFEPLDPTVPVKSKLTSVIS